MILCFDGHVGTGKSLSAANELLPWIKRDFRVVSNIPITGFTIKFQLRRILKFQNPYYLKKHEAVVKDNLRDFLDDFTTGTDTIYFADEAGDWFDNYAWESIPIEVYRRFRQHRKYGVHLIYTAQSFMEVAKN